MKRYSFLYEKKNGDQGEYDVMITNSTPERIYGIDLNKLSDEEKEKVIAIQEEYEEKIAPYIKIAYRQFIKENILTESDEQENS